MITTSEKGTRCKRAPAGLTKNKLNTWLNKTSNKQAIENLGYDKINQLFSTSFDEFTPNSQLSQTVIDYFNNTNNYNAIFK